MGTVLVGGEGGLLIYMTFFATTDPIERADLFGDYRRN